MNLKVIKYYAGELSSEERQSLYQEVLVNEELKKEMIDYRHIGVMMKMQLKEDEQVVRDSLERFLRRRKIHHLKKSFLNIAAFLVCILSTWWMSQSIVSRDVPVPVQLEVNAPAGQRAHALLPDGTSVWVNAGSTLRYPSVFGEERRVSVTGEAFFEVAKGEKPFIVSTGKMDVRALGTQFNVYNYPSENLVVSLVEGAVKVYSPDDEQDGVTLAPHQQVTEEGDGHFKVSTFKDNPISWKEGIYSFEHLRMADILKKLELYYDVKFTVKYERMLGDRITLKFRQSDGVMEVLRIIRKLQPFRVKKVEDSNEIILYR